MNNDKYVWNNVEVRLTGRIATRMLRNKREVKLYEVEPADPEQGSFKNWVQITELYKIEE